MTRHGKPGHPGESFKRRQMGLSSKPPKPTHCIDCYRKLAAVDKPHSICRKCIKLRA